MLKLENTRNYFVLAGDLNARHPSWGDNTHNQRGKYIEQWKRSAIILKTIILHPKEPTYPSASSYIDMLLMDSRLSVDNLINGKLDTCEYESDHKALKFTVNLQELSTELTIKEPISSFIYKKTDWKKFGQKANENFNLKIPNERNLHKNEIETYLSNLAALIRQTINEVVPKNTPSNSTDKYLNRKIKKLRAHKSFLLTQLLRNQNRYNENQMQNIKALIKNISQLIKNEFEKSLTLYWENKIKNIDHRKSDTFFPSINQLFRAKEPPKIEDLIIPEAKKHLLDRVNCKQESILHINNEFRILDSKIKLDVLGAHYETVNSPNNLNEGTRLREIVDIKANDLKNKAKQRVELAVSITQFDNGNRALNPKEKTVDGVKYFCHWKEILKIFRSLPNKTSTGLDDIPAIILKHLALNIIKAYTILFNNLLNLCHFPEVWKIAKVRPIPKKDKNLSDPASYRPISLLPNISKVYECIIKNSINDYNIKNNILPHNQFGFRYNHSAIHAITKLMSDVNENINKNNIVAACLIDLEKAFDTIWHNGLLFKLEKKGFPKHLTHLISNMISNKSFVVSDGENCTDKTFSIIEGLQQGSVCSPDLFNIFLDGLNLYDLNSNNNTFSIAFADDAIIYVAGKKLTEVQSKLQDLVNKINQHYQMWNLKKNPKKCETIIFRKVMNDLTKSSKTGIQSFKITAAEPGTENIVDIPHKKVVKYLGFNVDNLTRLNKHIDIQLKKAENAFYSNIKLFKSNYLSKRAKIICYQLLIRPILCYAAPIWWNISASTMEKLRKFERKCLRACLNLYRTPESNFQKYYSNKVVLNEANIPRIDSFTLKLTRDFFQRCHWSKNDIIKNFTKIEEKYVDRCAYNGYLPPEAFTILDRKGLIQDGNNIPIIYHIKRNRADKKIKFLATSINDKRYKFRYCKSLPARDEYDDYRIKNNYWWKAGCNMQLEEIRVRTRFKN